MQKQGLIVKKQEMTKLRIEGNYEAVTLVKVPVQEVVRKKTIEKDGYSAVLLGSEKKTVVKEKGHKVSYKYQFEVKVKEGGEFSNELSTGDMVTVVGISQGKGFQGVMKRHNFGGGPATHGSKFHRAGGSTGNRKPRRTIRGWKMAGRMGTDRITLKNRKVLDQWETDEGVVLAIKGPLPGAYNSYLQLTA